jgi:hypothetical protein
MPKADTMRDPVARMRLLSEAASLRDLETRLAVAELLTGKRG